MPKTEPITLTVESKGRRKNPPSSAFKKGEPNPHAFQPGESGNPSGKAKTDRLLTRSLRARLDTRAPDAIAKALGLSRGASYAMCISAQVVNQSLRGDLAATELILKYTEPAPQKIELTGEDGASLFQPGTESMPLLRVVFESTGYQDEYDAAQQRQTAPVIDALPVPSDDGE